MASWPSTTLHTTTTHDVTAHVVVTRRYVSAHNLSDPTAVGDMPAVAVAPYTQAATAGMSAQAHRAVLHAAGDDTHVEASASLPLIRSTLAGIAATAKSNVVVCGSFLQSHAQPREINRAASSACWT